MKQTITLTITFHHDHAFARPSTGLWRKVDEWAKENGIERVGISSTNETEEECRECSSPDYVPGTHSQA